ncbi:MAG: hypothetical protein ACRC3B_20345 [Bacteroidia bacterium]
MKIKLFVLLILFNISHLLNAAPDSTKHKVYKPVEIQLILTDSAGKDTVKFKNTYAANHPKLELKQSTVAKESNSSPAAPVQPAKTETTGELLAKLLLGILIGAAGQGIRVVAGIKKLSQTGESFDSRQILASFLPAVIIGAVCGLLVIVDDPAKNFHDRTSLITILVAGYAGSDFIEAFIKKHLTPEERLERKVNVANQQPK